MVQWYSYMDASGIGVKASRYTTIPQRNIDFWMQKFQTNIARDRRDVEKLTFQRIPELLDRIAEVIHCDLAATI